MMKVLAFLALAACFYVATAGLPVLSTVLFTLPWLGSLGAFTLRGTVALAIALYGWK